MLLAWTQATEERNLPQEEKRVFRLEKELSYHLSSFVTASCISAELGQSSLSEGRGGGFGVGVQAHLYPSYTTVTENTLGWFRPIPSPLASERPAISPRAGLPVGGLHPYPCIRESFGGVSDSRPGRGFSRTAMDDYQPLLSLTFSFLCSIWRGVTESALFLSRKRGSVFLCLPMCFLPDTTINRLDFDTMPSR